MLEKSGSATTAAGVAGATAAATRRSRQRARLMRRDQANTRGAGARSHQGQYQTAGGEKGVHGLPSKAWC